MVTLLLGQTAFAAGRVDPREAVEQNPGDFTGAVKHLGGMLKSRPFFDISRPSESEHYAAKRILSLERMGKISVHSPEVKRAFSFDFLMTYRDPTHRHEALALYQRIPVANSADPYWRIVRARCARLMDLPETPQLYEQVAAEMTGVPPNDEVRRLWDANRKEFNLSVITQNAWRRQITQFEHHARGPDVPGSLTIPANLLPLLDLAIAFPAGATDWETALDDPSNTSAKTLDGFYAEAKKFGELPWRDGRGFLNTEQVLNTQLLTQPGADMPALRRLQEAGYLKAVARANLTPAPLALFRRYPWSASAQAGLLKSAQQNIFQGQAQSAHRSFQDVLRHAEAKELRDQAQVGLWLSLAQFASPDAVAKAFQDIDANATWPWYGKREKTAVIKAALVKADAKPIPSPTLASLKLHTVRLPPVRIAPRNVSVFSVDMQREGKQLLVSSPSMSAMYAADNPAKPLWIQRKGAGGGNARFAGQHVVTPLEGEYRLGALRRSDGTIGHEGDPHDPQSRYRYRTVGGPVTTDGMAYAVQFGQPGVYNTYGKLSGARNVALSCFAGRDLKHLWTRSYETIEMGSQESSQANSVLPRVSHGAVYFCTNAGHVIRADCRDGEMEWIHFFRPGSTIGNKPASPWCLGARPIVTEDKVICLPKYTGYLFALDKATGRRLWRSPLLEGRELLGIHENLLLVVGANCLYAVDVNTGQLRWAREIALDYGDGFHLPRSQMIGSSIYCGTKNTLYRFHAGSGALLESRDWAMGGEVPMRFLISGTDLYAISDLALKHAVFERQLVEYVTVIHPGGGRKGPPMPLERKDGSLVFCRAGMLICVKGDKVLWSRFLAKGREVHVRESEQGGTIEVSGSGFHDSATGRLLRMRGRRWGDLIKIETK